MYFTFLLIKKKFVNKQEQFYPQTTRKQLLDNKESDYQLANYKYRVDSIKRNNYYFKFQNCSKH